MTRTPTRRIAAFGLLTAMAGSGAAVACELDGLSHGYGPMAALFAGAHRYQALNGLDEEDAPPPEAGAAESTPVADAAPKSAVTPPPAPRPSFAAWAKARPKPVDAAASVEAPAAWTRVSAAPADAPADTAPAAPAASARSN